MVDYLAFNSHDEMIAWLGQQQQQVEARDLDEGQQGLSWNDCWVRWGPGNTTIFGRVVSEQMLGLEEPHVQDHYRQRMRDGWLWSYCSSYMEPGEYGTVHRSAVWPISEATYEAAKSAGWVPGRMPEYDRLAVEQAAYDARRWHTKARG